MGSETGAARGFDGRGVVLAELERILASTPFRGSRRSQEFLRYVVQDALDGRTDMLKERSLGVGVFGRPVDYDTGEDAIVGVKASEVRKRLAQYYLESGPGHAVQFELHCGLLYAGNSFRRRLRGRSGAPHGSSAYRPE